MRNFKTPPVKRGVKITLHNLTNNNGIFFLLKYFS